MLDPTSCNSTNPIVKKYHKAITFFKDNRNHILTAWENECTPIRAICNDCKRTLCCNLFTMIHPLEGIAIAIDLAMQDRVTPDLVSALYRMKLEQDSYVTALHALLQTCVSDFALNKAMDEMLAEWANKNIPCPFLNTYGRCNIYSLRPTACRCYYVTDYPCYPSMPLKVQREMIDSQHVAEMMYTEANKILGHILTGSHRQALFMPTSLPIAVYNGFELCVHRQVALDAHFVDEE